MPAGVLALNLTLPRIGDGNNVVADAQIASSLMLSWSILNKMKPGSLLKSGIVSSIS
jgi:hypothetical protein